MGLSFHEDAGSPDAALAGSVLRWPAAWRRFWFEPWHWADAGWFASAGVPRARYLNGSLAVQRVLMAGWCAGFALEGDVALLAGTDGRRDAAAVQWARWLNLLAGDPGRLHLAARLVGWTLRPDAEPLHGVALTDPARQQALHYLQARPLRITLTDSGRRRHNRIVSAAEERHAVATALGLDALQRLTAIYAPPLRSRVAMMLPPDSDTPWFTLAYDDAPLEQQAMPAHLARLWHAAWRWAARMSPGRDTGKPGWNT